MIVYLIGLTGVGKSTIGKRLAKRMAYYFVDLDAYIEMRSGKRIPALFEQGEQHFRALEAEALESLAQDALKSGKNLVVATGGGIVTTPSNITFMRKTGYVVHLTRPLEDILSSFNTEKRPLFKGQPEKLMGIYNERRKAYESAGHIQVVCTKMAHAIKQIQQEVNRL